MVLKLWTMSQYELLNQLEQEGKIEIPERVSENLKEKLEILCMNYGKERDCERDLGGFCVLSDELIPNMRNDDLSAFKDAYRLDTEMYEYRDIILVEKRKSVVWVEELYIASSDFNLIFIYPVRKEGGEQYDNVL